MLATLADLKSKFRSLSLISLSLLVASEDKGVLTMDFVDSAWFRSVCYAGVSLFYVVKQYDYADLLGVRAVEKREE